MCTRIQRVFRSKVNFSVNEIVLQEENHIYLEAKESIQATQFRFLDRFLYSAKYLGIVVEIDQRIRKWHRFK